MDLLFSDALLLPMTAEEPRTFAGNLGIAGNRIELVSGSEIEKRAFLSAHPEARIVDCRGRLVMPGLIDTHCHAGMTLQRSYADDLALMEWLNGYIWPFESHQTADDVVLGMTLGIVELLLGGVTSFVDMYFHEDRGVQVARQLGIRALLGCSYFDCGVGEALRSAERAMVQAAGCDRVSVAVAPHSGYTCSPENLVRGKEFCRQNGLLFMSHVAETMDESRMLAERYGKTPVRHFDALGLLDERTIADHCVYVDDDDIAILADRGVIVSHNPQSNMKLSSGVAPVWKMMRVGVRMTVGTDGPCSNNDLDMFEELRTAVFLQKSATGDPLALPAYEALKLMTANGARAMGYADGELGVLRKGALADVIVIDLQKPHLQPIHDVVSNLVYCGKSSDVEMVVVDGEPVVEDRRISRVDLPELYRKVAASVERILADCKRENAGL